MFEELLARFDFIEPNNSELKIIVGVCAYKQTIRATPLKVSVVAPINPIYKSFDEIAFLVTDWVKAQDSLKMIFNLFCRPNKSLELLSYLKSKNISPIDFANFLFDRYKIILVNHHVKHKNNILKLIKSHSVNNKVHVLIVGEKASFSLPQNPNIEYAQALHSSGVNLNNSPMLYHDTWYNLNNQALKQRTSNFTLDTFRILN